MSDIENDLRQRIEAFVDELSALIRQEALEAVRDVLDNEGGRAPDHALRAPRQQSLHASPLRRRGEKRSPDELAKLTEQLREHIHANAGQTMENIALALKT